MNISSPAFDENTGYQHLDQKFKFIGGGKVWNMLFLDVICKISQNQGLANVDPQGYTTRLYICYRWDQLQWIINY